MKVAFTCKVCGTSPLNVDVQSSDEATVRCVCPKCGERVVVDATKFNCDSRIAIREAKNGGME